MESPRIWFLGFSAWIQQSAWIQRWSVSGPDYVAASGMLGSTPLNHGPRAKAVTTPFGPVRLPAWLTPASPYKGRLGNHAGWPLLA